MLPTKFMETKKMLLKALKPASLLPYKKKIEENIRTFRNLFLQTSHLWTEFWSTPSKRIGKKFDENRSIIFLIGVTVA